ncbi:GspE/PulE family protein [Caldanaerobius polysaccharolyticus]|uniref:GspE/PulE family protein n=1 Tax=Caldanaerobius polysaccharolyticus TaxID=44256 RepID=UPI000479C3AD|nr:ATPase, T2SS/T4P/T4SS family [Caldanaerobius polysaccharolyticus]
MGRRRLGDILIESGIVTRDELQEALKVQEKTGKRLGKVLSEMGYITEDKLIEILEFQLGIPHVDLKRYYIDKEAVLTIPEDIAKRDMLIAVKKDESNIYVAMSDPMDILAIDDVKLITGLNVIPMIATEADITEAIKKYYEPEEVEKAVNDFDSEYTGGFQEQNDEVDNAPAVRLVNSIIEQAVRSQASDIHIEPSSDDMRVRFRIDGQLIENMSAHKSIHGPVITRIKIMSNLNIAERRLPQDGRIELNVDGKEMDIRVSVLPTVFGEKAVLRLLDRSSFLVSKHELGLDSRELILFDRFAKSSHGIILVTGPTGSGKTTTLYTMLREINTPDKNIITVEDPVEYVLPGVNQVQVNEKAGLTFAAALRSILRQDPDIIMIGEIRDAETAQIAVRSAITGHLVLSTLHTNDAPGSVVRLIDMGVEPYLVSASLVGVIAQRLMRKVCEACKYAYKASEVEKRLLGYDVDEELTLYRGRGCTVCNKTGYRGRLAVFEIMPVSREIREQINMKASVDAIRAMAIEQGMVLLRQSARQKVLEGLTTVDEMLRITYMEE